MRKNFVSLHVSHVALIPVTTLGSFTSSDHSISSIGLFLSNSKSPWNSSNLLSSFFLFSFLFQCSVMVRTFSPHLFHFINCLHLLQKTCFISLTVFMFCIFSVIFFTTRDFFTSIISTMYQSFNQTAIVTYKPIRDRK